MNHYRYFFVDIHTKQSKEPLHIVVEYCSEDFNFDHDRIARRVNIKVKDKYDHLDIIETFTAKLSQWEIDAFKDSKYIQLFTVRNNEELIVKI